MKRFKNLLVYVQGNPAEDIALPRAVDLAMRNNATIKVIGVVGSESWPSQRPRDEAFRELRLRRKELDDYVASFKHQGPPIEVVVVYGRPADEISRHAIYARHDLVIKQARPEDEGVHRWFVGTTGRRLLRICPCPVWLIRPNREDTRSIIAAIDLVNTPERQALDTTVMELAISLAELERKELHVVHTWSGFAEFALDPSGTGYVPRPYHDHVTEAVQEYLQPYHRYLRRSQIHIECGTPKSCIPDLAQDIGASTVVMGMVAKSGLSSYLVSNSAEKVLPRVEASVMAVRQPVSLIAADAAIPALPQQPNVTIENRV